MSLKIIPGSDPEWIIKNMKLFLYGGGKPDKKNKFNKTLEKLIGNKGFQVGYIPSSGDRDRRYFEEFKMQFSKLGLKKFLFLSLENKYSKKAAKNVLNCNAIYLSGGNTYHFLWWLRKRRFLSRLKSFVKKGGILMGSSAGSILMCPNINTSGVPYWDCDKNKIGIENINALHLVDFEFFPHYKYSQKLDKELIKYSKTTPFSVFAVPEAGGIIIWEKEIKIIDCKKAFYKGNVLKSKDFKQLKNKLI